MINTPLRPLGSAPPLHRSLTSLKGIGPKRGGLLAQRGLHSLFDLVTFLPVRYEDRRRAVPIHKAGADHSALIRGQVVRGREERFFRSRKRLFKIVVRDDTGSLDLVWFHYRKPHLTRFTQPGLDLMVYGRIQMNRGRKQMIHPDITPVAEGTGDGVTGFVPVYPAVGGMSGQTMRKLVRQALEQCLGRIEDGLPAPTLQRLDLPSLTDAIRDIHLPSRESSRELLSQFRTSGHRRLIFDRFFQVLLAIALRKRLRGDRQGHRLSLPAVMAKEVADAFPFTLTRDQMRAVHEVFRDLRSGRPMNRLIQGDVGCGKTVVAAAAAHAAIRNGRQAALMVPTQVLAQQHYGFFAEYAPTLGFKPVLLIGALKPAERMRVREKIQEGACNVIVGTHALIQQGVSFGALGLVVIDEQHRFGVRQRALMDRKGLNPHLLVMTATPIPRTLAMTLYADLDISVIREYPEGHRPVQTRIMPRAQKREVYEILKQRLSAGEQAFVVCPVIEASEELDLKDALEMHAALKKLFSGSHRIGLVHGRLGAEEKGRVTRAFREGEIDLLVGTTVIEVGVDAPGATLMIIEHPERFGLSQLHQLRGRVGRGSKQGLCLLMISDGLSSEARERLEILARTTDGFEIAQKDLELRGHGELMGLRQTGAGELDLGEVFREPELLMAAKEEAEGILQGDPTLARPEHRFMRQRVVPGDGRIDL